jgi:hypothetical protein
MGLGHWVLLLQVCVSQLLKDTIDMWFTTGATLLQEKGADLARKLRMYKWR